MARILYFDADIVAFNRLKQIIGSRPGHTCTAVQKAFEAETLKSKDHHEILFCDTWTKFDKAVSDQAFDLLVVGAEKILKGTEEQVARLQNLKPASQEVRVPVAMVDHAVDRKKLIAVSKLQIEDFWIKPYDEPLLIQKLDLMLEGGQVEAQVFNFGTKTPTHIVFDAEISSVGPFGLAVRLRKPIRAGEMVEFNVKTSSEEKHFEMNLKFDARCLQSVDMPNNPVFKHQGLFLNWGMPHDKAPRFRVLANSLKRKNSLASAGDLLARIGKVLDAVDIKVTAAFRTGQADAKMTEVSNKKATWRKRLNDLRGKLNQLNTHLGVTMDDVAWNIVRTDMITNLTELDTELNTTVLPLLKGGKP